MEDITFALVVLLFIGYLAIYLGSRKYLEPYADQATDMVKATTAPQMTAKHVVKEKPVDDYEISAVFHNEGSREASKQQLSDAMTRYPLDWSTQGPNSQYFQENQVQYTKDTAYATQPAPFTQQGLEAPVEPSLDEEERKILQTYQPKSSKDLLTYSVDDVKQLLDNVYTKKGLIPVIHKSKQGGDNVWEITELKEKNPVIQWENDDTRVNQVQQMRGEDVISVPYPASDLAAGLNPFANPRNRVGIQPTENPQWTPGVDRMFTPSYPIPEWN